MTSEGDLFQPAAPAALAEGGGDALLDADGITKKSRLFSAAADVFLILLGANTSHF